MKRALVPALAAALLLPGGPVSGQQDPPPGAASPQLVDRIVAVVDEEPILLSDLEREIESYLFELQSMGQQPPEDQGEVRQRMLDRLIEVKLMVAQAKRDGLVVGEEELEAGVRQAMRDIESRFGSRQALEAELRRAGLTYEDLEARNRELVRDRMYTGRILDVYVRPEIEVRDDEIREYYEENRDQIPRQSASVELANILIVPQPDEAIRERIERKLGEIRRALSAGTPFAEVAREYSEGPNASRGGAVGTFGRGDLFSPVLEDLAWSLPLGQISEPVNTELGTHLIQVTERTDDEVAISQILLPVEIAEAERTAARERAAEVAAMARSGQDFAELARKYSDDPESRENDGLLGTFEVDRLSETFASAVETLEVGEVSDPVGGAAGFFVLKLLDRRGGEVYAFDEVEGRIREILFQQKAEAELEDFVDSLRERFYIEVKA
jgi:peptidyl-prolyl cis-trans isomerase SurA